MALPPTTGSCHYVLCLGLNIPPMIFEGHDHVVVLVFRLEHAIILLEYLVPGS
jgi:hypothetical protein